MRFVRRLSLVLLVLIASYVVAEVIYREYVYAKAREDWSLHRLIFYSEPLTPKENRLIHFRFYGKDAEKLLSADFRLNNLGYFSGRDYSVEKQDDEYRIVALGGEQTASSVADVSWPDLLEDALNADEDLKRTFDRTFRVLNLAWPDAGPAHYEEYWKEKGKQFDPDLVIINLVETDYWRTGTGVPPTTFRGKPIQGYRIDYRLGPDDDDIARVAIVGIEPVDSLRDPTATSPRPFGVLASRKFMDDPERVRELQRRIVADFIAGARDPSLRPWLLLHLFGERLDPVAERNFDPLPFAPSDQATMVARARRHLGAIVDDHPNVLIVHHPNLADMFPTRASYPLTEMLVESDPKFKVLDIRDYLPVSRGEAEARSWYLHPHLPEKWSNKGHKVYAQAMAKVVKDFMEGGEAVTPQSRQRVRQQ